MGTMVSFASLPHPEVAGGVGRSPLSDTDATHMSAEMLRLASGARIEEQVPAGVDLYLYALTGSVQLESGGSTQVLTQDTFATIEENTALTLINRGATPAELVRVVAPPAGSRRPPKGFQGGIALTTRASAPAVDIPDQKKRRLYFVDPLAAHSERAHAMIVEYQAETVTSMHAHPNADSMFVPLTGKVRFSFDGTEQVLGRGGAIVFPAGNRHGLCVAEGPVSFLEFHIPAAYTTVR
jgi:quercetin dioxygenase-like cupin family protein